METSKTIHKAGGEPGALTSAFGVYQDFYNTKWLSSYSTSAISWIGGVQIFLELFLGPVGGKMLDAGYAREANIAGCLLFTFRLRTSKPPQGVGMGAGIGILYIPAMTIVSHHFHSKRALVMVLHLTALVTTVILNNLLHGDLGFVWGTRIVAFMTLGCFILGNFLIFVPEMTRSAVAPPSGRTSITDAPYLLTMGWGFFASLGMYFPSFYLQVYARKHGISEGLAFYSLAIMNASSIAGRLVGFAMLGSTTPGGLVGFAILYGFFFGATTYRMGIAILPVGVACLVGPPISGAILGNDFRWLESILFASQISAS
ncbi:hypothetical protein OF83DRAFT_1161394 [Amylostereum chailletii]|nr:hypothetical protein OF83DRAFT_1161394 [Amylostereum chailletii]